MPTILQFAEFQESSAHRDVAMLVTPTRDTKRMKVEKHRMSAIEHIVETAHSGEVIYVDEKDYYNQQLWRSYEGLSTRYFRP